MKSLDHIAQIESKINRILEENRNLKEELSRETRQLQDMTLELNYARERIKNLENQIKINNIAKGNLEGKTEVKEMREKLNEVIREVDKCIRYLKG